MVAYIDAILIYAKIEEELLELTKHVLQKLENNRLWLNAKKCVFHTREVEFVGYTIRSKGIKMSDNKVIDILAWNAPSSVREVP